MPETLFNKVAGLKPATSLKKILWHRCFPVNFAKFLRKPFFQNTSGDCFCKGVRFSLRDIDIYSNYAWIVPLKDKKAIRTINAFRKMLGKSGCKPNKIWLDQGSDF